MLDWTVLVHRKSRAAFQPAAGALSGRSRANDRAVRTSCLEREFHWWMGCGLSSFVIWLGSESLVNKTILFTSVALYLSLVISVESFQHSPHFRLCKDHLSDYSARECALAEHAQLLHDFFPHLAPSADFIVSNCSLWLQRGLDSVVPAQASQLAS